MSALYIHIPFCEKKCFYCSFVVAVAQEQRAGAYLDSLQREAQRWQGTRIDSLYIGGGTPTRLSPAQLNRLFQIIRGNFSLTSSASEITVEANPEGVDLEKTKTLLNLGVNRISLGVQTFKDHYLKFLGRCHDSRTAVKTFGVLRNAGFDNINVDLMYGFPQQTLEEIEEDLQALQDLKPEHVSLYTLTVEENSRFFAQKLVLPNNQRLAEQYEFVARRLGDLGYQQYEISNFSRPGRESKHNINYWRGGNYIGLGVGAHSHQDGHRAWNLRRVNDYINRLNNGESVVEGAEDLTAAQRLAETFVFGLRMNPGVDVEALQRRFHCVFNSEQEEKIKEFLTAGFLTREKDNLKVTPQGRLVLDELATYLV